MINFLITHLIKKVRERSSRICNAENYSGFVWFEKKFVDGKHIIDRMDEKFLYSHEEVVPVSWYILKPSTVFEIYKSIKRNEIYLKRRDGNSLIKSKPHELELH